MDLVILDSSQYVYAGYFGSRNGNYEVCRGVRQNAGMWEARSFQIKGASFLFREMQRLSGSDKIIMPVFDRIPTIKRAMWNEVFGDYPGYKGKRSTKKDDLLKIRFNKDFAEECCRRMDFPVQAAEDYEADDVIYTLCRKYRDDFSNIYVHTYDGDLSFLVDDVISIRKVGKNGKDIDMQNYEYTVAKDTTIVYNLINVNRLLTADISDSIEGIGTFWADYINEYVTFDNARKFGDLDFARDILRKVVKAHSDSPNADRVLSTFNLMNPLLVPDELIDDYEHDVDWDMMYYYFNDGLRETADRWGFEEIIEKYMCRWEEEII